MGHDKKCRDAIKTKESIINSATKLFALKGYDGVSVDAIAHDAKANKAMIYYYYKNKATLYKVVVDKVLDEIYNDIKKEAKAYSNPTQKLDSFIKTFARYAYANPYLSSLMLSELGNGGKNLPDDIFMGLKKLFFLLSQILKEGKKKGCFKEYKAILIHFMIVGTINLFITTKELRSRVEDEYKANLCKECEIDEIANYISSSIQKVLKGEK